MALLAELWRYFLLWLGRGTPTEWETKGPERQLPATVDDLLQRAEVHDSPEPWTNGWWLHCVHQPAHVGRVGPPIVPSARVIHTTDTYPGGFKAIVKSWTTQKGKGNAAHFMIGRTEADGVVQFMSITRNANHAGGKTCGHWKHGVRKIHPNTVSVGIELDCAGRLKQYSDGGYYHPDTGKEIPISEVYFDSKGRPWHKVTEYQLYTLRKLMDDLNLILKPSQGFPIPSDDYAKHGVAHYARPWRPDIVGHVTLDPINKLDPGPQVMEWLRKEYP